MVGVVAVCRACRLPLGPLPHHRRPWRPRGRRHCWFRGPTEAPPPMEVRVRNGLGLPPTGRAPPALSLMKSAS
eukprot:8310885-Alexandrium_andersonii.AAC.1